MIGFTCALFALTVPAAAAQQPPVSPVAAAPDAERLDAATRLLNAMNIERQYDSMLGQMIPVMTAQIFEQVRDSATTPDALRQQLSDPATLQRLRQTFTDETAREFRARYGRMKSETAQEYARTFTTAELEELIRFYASPVGRKALETLPELQQRLFPIGMRIGAEAGQAAMKTTLERVSLESKRPTS